MTNTPPGKAPKHANPKTKDVGVFWTHLDRRLLLSNTDSRYACGQYKSHWRIAFCSGISVPLIYFYQLGVIDCSAKSSSASM